ncbi:type I-E CRISPR-associated protein Cse1/CasA [Jonesiaceae bacterium BS-20]|uniref:Type I-E CRISPR-associated protein Cse1/CasA n=1 Tax=Jonesiaceae bacterium BS-20 TaxID=3120821 RepID=A0AAU7DX22_9MICO
MTSYDLRTEPWIPVLYTDGTSKRLGLLSIFEDAQEILTIGTELPTQRFALQRLLLAILHRAFGGPATIAEWEEIAGQWKHHLVQVTNYLDRYASHFDLFHPEYPFMQVPNLRTSKDEVFGLERLIMDVPAGHPFFTMRAGKGTSEISHADAALWLVNTHAYDISGIKSGAVGDPRVKGGKGYPIGTGWCGELLGIQASGSNLKETLLYNLFVPGTTSSFVNYSPEKDLPYWERRESNKGSNNEESAPRASNPENPSENFATGFVDLYTWQSRRIRLVSNGTSVTNVLVCNGDKMLAANTFGLEPQSLWRFSQPQTAKFKTDTYMPAMVDPNRAVWRGLENVLAETTTIGKKEKRTVHPGITEFIGALRDEEVITRNQPVTFQTVGVLYGPQQSSFAAVTTDSLVFSAATFQSQLGALRAVILEGVNRVERCAYLLGDFAVTLSLASGDKNSDLAKDAIRVRYYTEIDTHVRAWIRLVEDVQQRVAYLKHLDEMVFELVNQIAYESIKEAPQSAIAGIPDPQESGQGNRWLNAATAQRTLQWRIRNVLEHLNTDVTAEEED